METRTIAEIVGAGATMLLAAGSGDWVISLLLLGAGGAVAVMATTRAIWKS